MMEGHHFQLRTDHKPLLAALNHVSQPWTPRQQLQLAFITECTSHVWHVPGLSNMVADQLSRPPPTLACLVATYQLPTAPMCLVATSDLPAGP